MFHFNRGFLILSSLVAATLLPASNRFISVPDSGEGMEENPLVRNTWELKMLADPTGTIPEGMRAKELAFASTLPVNSLYMHGETGGRFWQNRGPWNVGGRTRAIAIDVTNENVIIAASVSGGIWRSDDGGRSWNKMTRPDQQPNITCIAQDTRPGKTNTWYAGTGEYLGNSASGNNAFYLGDGILKSVDGGRSWDKLASTASGRPQSFGKDFDIVNSIVVNKADTADIVYAATYGGIYRTINGGKTWNKVLGITSQFGATSSLTEVAITSSGILYAGLSSDGQQKGLWRSVDGLNWVNITPSGFAGTYMQVAIGIDPNNENEVYFLANTPNYGGRFLDFRGVADWASFWKYTYVSGNGTGTGGNWEDRTNNLPAVGGDFGNFNTQQGYNMYVRIKPGDPNTIFIGSTNLWRSADAFTSKNNISWIGGYGPGSKMPMYQLYENQHPDQHNLVFYPSNPNKMLSASDGGIARTTDNGASTVVWESLNAGYLTSQFYTIAIDHASPGNSEIIGGLQDNGTFMTRTEDALAGWTMPGRGDGSYCAVFDGRSDYIVSSQLGKTYHIKIDNTGNAVEWARIDPAGAKTNHFINPFALDPNNQKRMYYVARRHVWFNNDITQIPLQTKIDTNPVLTGWSWLPQQKDSSQEISTAAVSSTTADRLYYGTVNGRIYRVNNASTGIGSAINITGTNFPSGYINNICIDPENADKVIVVFSNYSIVSAYYTTNGGTSWTPISGNLEQFASGSGNGPSCRWAAILPLKGKHAYFMATSTGLYSTDTLQGINTVWVQQDADGMGNAICTMIDTRPSDGLVVVATHGQGVYSANFLYPYQATGVKKPGEASDLTSLNIFPNPASSYVNLTWDSPANEVSIIDEKGSVITLFPVSTSEKRKMINVSSLTGGLYYVRLKFGGDYVSKPLVIH